MRTTLEISDPLFREAKRRAANDGVSLRQVVETSLQSYLARRPAAAVYTFRWRTERGRIQPGVRLDDRDALFDLMEGRR
jgi:hypothetical protein